MTKKLHFYIGIFILSVLMQTTVSYPVFAAAADSPSASQNTTVSGQPDLPESYYWPIQSNDIPDWPQGPAIQAETAIVMEASSGTILYAKNIDEQRFPASITKIMTTLVALENSSLDEQVTFSENAIWGIERDSTHIGIKIGETLTMEQSLYGIMLASANEVAYGVAEHVGGSMDGFVEMMNQKARELGCTNTHFVNSHGLHDENHYTSAHDMALICQAALRNETFRTITGTRAYTIPVTNLTNEERWLDNHQKMLCNTKYQYDGCIGGKTGYTSVAGNTLVTFANRDGMELISVVMKDRGANCYIDSTALLDYGFNEFQKLPLENAARVTSTTVLDFDRQFFRGLANQTIFSIPYDASAIIPKTASMENLTKETTFQRNKQVTDYIYNKQLVGTVQKNFFSFLPAPPMIRTVTHTPPGVKEKTSLSTMTSFRDLPAWKYPVIGFVVLALIFYVTSFVLNRRRKAKQKQKKREQQLKQMQKDSDGSFLIDNSPIDQDSLEH